MGRWVTQSPLEHPIPFLVMAVATILLMFDFLYFREQTCLIACPYGRFQSVMLDRRSLIVTYDHHRGEPRGRGKPVVQNDQKSKVTVSIAVCACKSVRRASIYAMACKWNAFIALSV